MHDLDYVVELAKAYGNALITRDELQDEIHSCSIETIMYAVNALNRMPRARCCHCLHRCGRSSTLLGTRPYS